MNWFKITVNDGSIEGYTYMGSAEETLESLVQKIGHNEMIRLDNLIYEEHGEIFKWEEWDNKLIPTVFITSKNISAIMQYKGDPK